MEALIQTLNVSSYMPGSELGTVDYFHSGFMQTEDHPFELFD